MFLYQIKVMINKELTELRKDKGLILSLLIVPLIFSIILPVLTLMLGADKKMMGNLSGINIFLKNISTLNLPKFLTSTTLPLYMILTYLFLPLFMLIPIMISTVLASNSFIGEKEKKTLEGLLYTPFSPKVLILGKALGAAIPSIILTFLSVITYSIIVNVLGWHYFNHIILPNFSWVLVTFIISPLLVLLSILMVIGSSQYLKNSKSSQGIAMVVIAPVFGMLISQATGILILGSVETVVFIVILLALTLVVFVFVVKHFNFEKFILNN